MTCPESDEEPSFLQILYHSITTKVVAINIQVSEAVIQDVFFYHSSITSEACRFYHTIENQHIVFYYFWAYLGFFSTPSPVS